MPIYNEDYETESIELHATDGISSLPNARVVEIELKPLVKK